MTAPVCWDGMLTPLEQKILRPLPIYALEQLRVRFLQALTTTRDMKKSARALAQLAYETEIGAAIVKVVPVAPEVGTSVVCERRRYLEIDADMQLFSFIIGPALEAAREEKILPEAYVRLFDNHLHSGYPQYRTCATAALLLIAAQLALP